MITANQAAALYAKSLNIPFIYRIHEPPAPEKIRTLATLANALGLKSHRVRQGLSPTDLSELLEQAKISQAIKLCRTKFYGQCLKHVTQINLSVISDFL